MVYLDIGSNLGVQVRKLFEQAKYPNAQIAGAFNEYFGNPDFRSKPSAETGICAIGFEANPAWQKRLKGLEQTYQRHGWHVQFLVPQAVSDVDNENITFYVDNTPGHHDWGASISRAQASGSSKRDHRKQDTSYEVTVQTLDISKFIRSKVLFTPKQQVVAKLDIEGAEYNVLPKMLEAGLLCKGNIDNIFIEWHPHWQGESMKHKYLTLKESLLHQIQHANYCDGAAGTTMLEIDDESYGSDGMSLPQFDHEIDIIDDMYGSASFNVTHILETTKAIHVASARMSIARQTGSS